MASIFVLFSSLIAMSLYSLLSESNMLAIKGYVYLMESAYFLYFAASAVSKVPPSKAGLTVTPLLLKILDLKPLLVCLLFSFSIISQIAFGG